MVVEMFDATLITNQNAVFSDNKIYYFKKTINLEKIFSGKVFVFADSRYKLYINDVLVGCGPLKGCEKEKYYDEFEISKYLRDGDNTFFAEVLQLKSKMDMSEHLYMTSVYRTGAVGFALQAEIISKDDTYVFATDKTWLTTAENGVKFIKPEYAYYAGLPEEINGEVYKRQPNWSEAVELFKFGKIFYGEISIWESKQRTVPMPFLKEEALSINENGIIDNKVLTKGYIKLKCFGHGTVKLTYAERYCSNTSEDRTSIDGELLGDFDLLVVDGELLFETFWFRTFRYIKLEIDGDVQINSISYIKTGYPLEVKDVYDFSNEKDNKLWEISLRTLKMCMQESYEDCPYYEQLQYAMDTFLQIIFTLQISDDDRLVRKAINDFKLSNENGYTQSRFPSMKPQYITGFMLFYVFMVYVHFKRYENKELIEDNINVIDEVLSKFIKNSNSDGFVMQSKYWEFIDWANGWEDSKGVAVADDSKPIAIITLMLAGALKAVCEMKSFLGETSDTYYKYSNKLINSVNENCFDKEKYLYMDSPNTCSYSQHMQIWAVLTGASSAKDQKKILENSFNLKSQASFAYMFFLLRAMEKSGIYNQRDKILNELYKTIENNCSTIPETPTNSRSECHAWGSVVLYEFTAMDLGVKAGDGEIVVKPYISNRNGAKGTVYTKYGKVDVEWKIEDDIFTINVETCSENKIRVILPNQKTIEATGKCYIAAYRLS